MTSGRKGIAFDWRAVLAEFPEAESDMRVPDSLADVPDALIGGSLDGSRHAARALVG